MNRLEKKCLIGLFALPIGISAIALAILSNPPTVACDSIREAPVSIRLYCAQRRAERDTPESLAAAIAMLESVPMDDPYHQQSTELVQRWSNELLAKAEAEVQAGNLDKGISMVQSLPQDAKVRSWKSLWEKGESLMKTALAQKENREWQQAFETARQLQKLDNQYWAIEQYNSLMQQIQSDREFRDWKLRNPVEPSNPINSIDFNPPKPERIVPSTRSLWKPQDEASANRPVSAIEQPKLVKPTPQIQPAPEPEPPVEAVQSQEPPKVEIPVPQPQKSDRTIISR